MADPVEAVRREFKSVQGKAKDIQVEMGTLSDWHIDLDGAIDELIDAYEDAIKRIDELEQAEG